MAKQWGHGFHTGESKGHEEGYERGLSVPTMMESEQMNVLIDCMARLFAKGKIGSEMWALLRTMSEVNAKNLITPERAWHNQKME